MKASSRVIVNTGAQYVRSIITVLITLYTSRVILENLGVNDYGIYSLVGGVISLFAFIQNSLTRTTQRYLNYHQGRKDILMVKKVFVNSLVTQMVIGIILCGVLLSLTSQVFHNLLNIEPERIHEAKIVYFYMIGSLFFNLLSTPYLATLIANENIIYSSIVQVLDSLLKLPIALSLFYISGHKLVFFSACTAGLTVLNFLLYFIYTIRKYPECQNFALKWFNIHTVWDMWKYAIWSTYGTFAIVGRTQGLAIIFNRFFSTAMNAAFGIGTQIIGQLGFLSVALGTAITPQIVKSVGNKEISRAIRLSLISAKFSVIIMGIVLVPIYMYIDFILSIWLKDVPAYTAMFVRFIIIITIVELYAQPFINLNGAFGKIAKFTFVTYTVALLTVPFAYLALKLGLGIDGAMYTYVISSALTSVCRLVMIHKEVGVKYIDYWDKVLKPATAILLLNALLIYVMSLYLQNWWVILSGLISAVFTVSLTWIIGLDKDEQQVLNPIIEGLMRKFKH